MSGVRRRVARFARDVLRELAGADSIDNGRNADERRETSPATSGQRSGDPEAHVRVALRRSLELVNDLRDDTPCDVRRNGSGSGWVCAQHDYVVNFHKRNDDDDADERCPHVRARELLEEFAPEFVREV